MIRKELARSPTLVSLRWNSFWMIGETAVGTYRSM